jgi:hypothetical protein
MKYLKLYENFNSEYKYEYDIISDDFLNYFKNNIPKDIKYEIKNNKIYSNDSDVGTFLEIYKKTFKYHKNISITKYEDVFKYSVEDYINKFGYEGFNNEKDAIEYLNNILKTNFPTGLLNVPEKVTLYRVLFLENLKDVNKKDFGVHYVADKELLTDNDFLGNIGSDNFSDDYKPYIFEVEVNRDDINYYWTIHNNLLYPREYEITLNKDVDVKIKKYEKLT